MKLCGEAGYSIIFVSRGFLKVLKPFILLGSQAFVYFYCSYFEFLLVVIWFEKVFVLKVESAILLYNHNILMIFSCKSSFMLRNSIQSFIQ